MDAGSTYCKYIGLIPNAGTWTQQQYIQSRDAIFECIHLCMWEQGSREWAQGSLSDHWRVHLKLATFFAKQACESHHCHCSNERFPGLEVLCMTTALLNCKSPIPCYAHALTQASFRTSCIFMSLLLQRCKIWLVPSLHSGYHLPSKQNYWTEGWQVITELCWMAAEQPTKWTLNSL